MNLSLVDEVCKGSFEQRDSLLQANWIRHDGEPMFDLHFNNILNHGIADEDIVTSLKQILTHILSLPTSNSL
jgi:hypothetical protein